MSWMSSSFQSLAVAATIEVSALRSAGSCNNHCDADRMAALVRINSKSSRWFGRTCSATGDRALLRQLQQTVIRRCSANSLLRTKDCRPEAKLDWTAWTPAAWSMSLDFRCAKKRRSSPLSEPANGRATTCCSASSNRAAASGSMSSRQNASKTPCVGPFV